MISDIHLGNMPDQSLHEATINNRAVEFHCNWRTPQRKSRSVYLRIRESGV